MIHSKGIMRQRDYLKRQLEREQAKNKELLQSTAALQQVVYGWLGALARQYGTTEGAETRLTMSRKAIAETISGYDVAFDLESIENEDYDEIIAILTAKED